MNLLIKLIYYKKVLDNILTQLMDTDKNKIPISINQGTSTQGNGFIEKLLHSIGKIIIEENLSYSNIQFILTEDEEDEYLITTGLIDEILVFKNNLKAVGSDEALIELFNDFKNIVKFSAFL